MILTLATPIGTGRISVARGGMRRRSGSPRTWARLKLVRESTLRSRRFAGGPEGGADGYHDGKNDAGLHQEPDQLRRVHSLDSTAPPVAAMSSCFTFSTLNLPARLRMSSSASSKGGITFMKRSGLTRATTKAFR
jgi:hypothetical protein